MRSGQTSPQDVVDCTSTDLGAPGVAIYSLQPGGGSIYRSGTSMATALVAAEAALLFSVSTDTNGSGRVNDEVRYAMENNTDQIEGVDFTQGRITLVRR